MPESAFKVLIFTYGDCLFHKCCQIINCYVA